MIQETQKPQLNIRYILLIRILLSPFVLFWGLLMTCAMMFFPLTLLCVVTLIHLIAYLFIIMFNNAGAEIEIPDPFINETKSTLVNYILTITIPIWGMFAMVVYFVKTGKVWSGE